MSRVPYDPKIIHPLFPHYCPCQDCPYYLDLDNYITLDGTYPVKKGLVRGKESDFGQKTQNTSYIERFNLTLRQKVSYLNRKTLGYCKNQQNGQSVLWINLFDYNYCQFHLSLRQDLTGHSQKFQRRYNHLTPAMKMGLTLTRLGWRDLIVAPITEKAHQFSTSTIL